jgi:hypothetical protein
MDCAMTLPGNVPNFSTYMVDFDHLESFYVAAPPPPRRRAWDKLVELERKLHAFDWATMVVRNPQQCTTLIADLAFAFVLGFEATLQVLRQEDRSRSEKWLTTLPQYDMPCRGIRTVRNLEAHVRSGQLHAGSGTGVYTHFMTDDPAASRCLALPADLRRGLQLARGTGSETRPL